MGGGGGGPASSSSSGEEGGDADRRSAIDLLPATPLSPPQTDPSIPTRARSIHT